MSEAPLGDRVVEAMRRGDARAVADLLVAAPEKQRRAIAGQVASEWEKVRWSPNTRDESPRRARAVAWAGTTTARKVAADWWTLGRDDTEELYQVIAARGRAFVEVVAGGLLKNEESFAWPLIRRAVRDGVIGRPESDLYVVRMAEGIAGWESWNDLDSIYGALTSDSELLEDEVWRLFDVDCGSELARAGLWIANPDGRGGDYDSDANRWRHALTRLAAEGRLDRDRLLDASLDALMRDFRESSVGWYAQLHEALEPTTDERRARIDRYLALLASSSPAAMKQGLAGLRAVEEDVPADGLARAVASPLTQKRKTLAVETLRLLERGVTRAPESASELLSAAAQALGHERQDVQERALAFLERHGEADPAARAAALGYAEVVSPLLRERVTALAGLAAPSPEVTTQAPPAEAWPDPVQPQMTPELLREVGVPLEPVESLDELIELGASLLEGAGSGDDAERFLDGVSRLCDQRPPELERRAAGLLKRAADRPAEIWGTSGSVLIASLVRAWIGRKRPPRPSSGGTVLGFVERRVREVAKRALAGSPRGLVALPTHAGGWIDPDVLAERLSGTGRFRNRPEPGDRQQASVRAFPALSPPVYRPERRADHIRVWNSGDSRWLALPLERKAHGLEGDLDVAAAATRDKPTEWWRGETRWAGGDALSVSWCLTVLPSLPQVAFAAALEASADRIDDSVYYHPDVVLLHALDPYVPLEHIGWMAAAAGLLAKSPDLHRPATDLVVQTIADGRFDPDGLGTGLAWLVDNGFGTISRLDRPLRDASRVSPLHGAQVVRLVAALLVGLTTTPRNLHVPLEVALEQATLLRTAVEPPQARAALERVAAGVSASSKLARAARGLLTREADASALAELRGQAVRAASR